MIGRRLRHAAAIALVAVGAAASPSTPAWAQMDSDQWLSARGAEELDLDLVAAEPVELGGALRLKFRAHNPGSEPVEDLQLTSRRGDAVGTTAQGRFELAAGEFPYFGATAAVPALAPGGTAEVLITVPTALSEAPTLAITEPGAYPLMFTLTGTREGEGNSFAEERMLVDVPPAAPRREAGEEQGPHDLTLIYPITADVDVVPGDTGGENLILSSDNLAAELAPDGRLSRLLDAYLAHDLRGAGCVALDPALVDTVDRMSRGYTVKATRPSIADRPKRLRDSWGSFEHNSRGKAGEGSAAAKAWLQRLAKLDCTMPIPWGNADASAVARTNNGFLQTEAFARGSDVFERVVGKPMSSDVLAVGSGYLSQPIAARALVADNTEWSSPAVAFDSSLAALLAQTGPRPQTVGYSNPALRYDFTVDSPLSRSLSAAAGLAVAAEEKDTVAKLPNYQGAAAAERVLDTAQRLLDTGAAHPRPLHDLPASDSSAEARTDGDEPDAGGEPLPDAPAEPGSPYPDPAAYSDAEIVRIEQQARYTDDLMRIMVDDPAIAMTRYGFTLPLRRDLLYALSLSKRASLHDYGDSVREADARLSGQSMMLRQLRDSVSLIPPGNVFTRTSESSPLLIVAENGLPLPVEAKLLYEASDRSTLNTPGQVRIPAMGSITVSMTAAMPSETDRTEIRLWLATPEDSTISTPINIAVQTRAGIVSVYGAAALAAIALVLATLFRLGKKKKIKPPR